MASVPNESKQPKPTNPKYLPHIPTNTLPPIKSFQLDHILKHQVAYETEQVVGSILEVSRRYRKDLKGEIRMKLSIEQKLQNKNIEIAKLARSIEKTLDKDLKALAKKGELNLGSETAEVVDLSESVTEKFRLVVKRLDRVGKRVGVEVDGSKYPLLKKYMAPQQRSEIKETDVSRSPPVSLSKDPALTEPLKDTLTDEALGSEQQTDKDPEAVTAHTTPKMSDDATNTKAVNNGKSVPKDLDDFESFMAHAIFNYRKQQSERYPDEDIFKEDDSSTSSKLFGDPHYDNSLSSSFHKSQNPIDLLHLGPLLAEKKSPAIVMQTLHTSHFKKLRINGSPITSATFKAKQLQDCGCKTDKSTNTNTTNATAGPGTISEGTEDVSVSSDQLSDFSSEEEFIDPIIHTGSDSDSSFSSSDSDDTNDHNSKPNGINSINGSGNGDITSMTNDYYASLHQNYKSRKQHSKKRFLRQKKRSQSSAIRADSPTPKHEPSHYKLKPKGSILKITTPRSKDVRMRENGASCPKSRSPEQPSTYLTSSSLTSTDLTSTNATSTDPKSTQSPPTSSALDTSVDNGHSDVKFVSGIADQTATGIFVTDKNDDPSLQSITILKTLVD